MENFDVKTRGPHQGTNAMRRAKIDLDDFGATDFFSAACLPAGRWVCRNRKYLWLLSQGKEPSQYL